MEFRVGDDTPVAQAASSASWAPRTMPPPLKLRLLNMFMTARKTKVISIIQMNRRSMVRNRFHNG
ncbi:MAG: hypothetical protein WAK82_17100 [Streptosporangiaceae bacterium]